MPSINSGGVKIYYEVIGQGDPLVMIQGYGHHSLQWGDLPDALAKSKYKIILIDNRGAGRSDKLDMPVTVPQMADDVCKVLDAISLKRTSVFGISMGGMIAQEFALHHPDRLINLVLGCTHPGGKNLVKPTPEGARIIYDFDYLRSMSPEQRTREVFRFFCSDEFISANPDALKKYHEATLVSPTPFFTFVRQAKAIAEFDAWDRLPDIKAPTMIISGTSDQVVPFQNSELLNKRIPRSELILLQDKRHGFFIEAMDATLILIDSFIKRQSLS